METTELVPSTIMREIKFRWWGEYDDKWHYGDLSHDHSTIYDEDQCFIRNQEEWYESEVDPETVWQFTGLHDKNKKDIYGGDIVYISWFGRYVCTFPFIQLYEAQMENDIWEIVGNIHEHSYLIPN